jgi:hypothetical protein
MKRTVTLFVVFLILFNSTILYGGDIYKKFVTNEISFVKGIVTEVHDRYFFVEDDGEVVYKIWLTPYTGYYPSDYALNLGDTVNVRCIKYSLVTNRLYGVEIQFIEENKIK